MIADAQLTKTEQKLFDLLKDGYRHHKNEIFNLLDMVGDDHDMNSVKVHICKLRKKIEGQGLSIIVEWWERKRYYLLVRKINSAYE